MRVLDNSIVEVWQSFQDLADIANCLAAGIMIGGLGEEQQFLLIPPNANNGKWGYWNFAYWNPGEVRYDSFEEYLKHELEFMKTQLSKGN